MTIKAHYDGKVFVPDEPVDLPTGESVTVTVQAGGGKTAADLLRFIEQNPDVSAMWEEIAAGRDSVEVARDLRRRAERRDHE
jgi:predicted DNA-binding antitoxin AbrB/MazE fold protein